MTQYLKDYLQLMRVNNVEKKKQEENVSGGGVPYVKAHKQEGKYIVGGLQASQLSWSIG